MSTEPGRTAGSAPVAGRNASLTLRFRERVATLLPLPWPEPLAEWPEDRIDFVDLPVGPSRHTVRFVADEGGILALKELPVHPARREYEVMREMEERGAPAVRVIGLVERPGDDAAILVTRYLARSFQFRRLFRRLPEGSRMHRERLLDAMANLLVELHRLGFFWGDCSLANTLLLRDGQTVQAYLVDAETSEVHEHLSDGQRHHDLDLAVENVAGDLADLAAMSGRGLDEMDDEFAAAEGLRSRYERLWDTLHEDIRLDHDQRFQVDARLRALNEMGFVVDEVVIEPGDAETGALRLRVAVASRRYHAQRLRQLTGMEVGEGQAAILLNDLTAWAGLEGTDSLEAAAPGTGASLTLAHGLRWLAEVYEPTGALLRATLGPRIDPVQSYCDLLEVRWLLSEQKGHDVGNEPSLRRIVEHREPTGSFAGMALVEETVPPVSGRTAQG